MQIQRQTLVLVIQHGATCGAPLLQVELNDRFPDAVQRFRLAAGVFAGVIDARLLGDPSDLFDTAAHDIAEALALGWPRPHDCIARTPVTAEFEAIAQSTPWRTIEQGLDEVEQALAELASLPDPVDAEAPPQSLVPSSLTDRQGAALRVLRSHLEPAPGEPHVSLLGLLRALAEAATNGSILLSPLRYDRDRLTAEAEARVNEDVARWLDGQPDATFEEIISELAGTEAAWENSDYLHSLRQAIEVVYARRSLHRNDEPPEPVSG